MGPQAKNPTLFLLEEDPFTVFYCLKMFKDHPREIICGMACLQEVTGHLGVVLLTSDTGSVFAYPYLRFPSGHTYIS